MLDRKSQVTKYRARARVLKCMGEGVGLLAYSDEVKVCIPERHRFSPGTPFARPAKGIKSVAAIRN
jgi:hypothetical protein